MNKPKKGRYYEYQVKKYLEKQGFKTQLAQRILLKTPAGNFLKGGDFFGAFDIMATSEKALIFAQVTADSNLKRKLEKINRVALPDTPLIRIYLFQKRKRGWILHYIREGKIWNSNPVEVRR